MTGPVSAGGKPSPPAPAPARAPAPTPSPASTAHPRDTGPIVTPWVPAGAPTPRLTHVGPVEVRGVTRFFGQRPALLGVDLELPPGSCTLLLGPNGAGKSTLLRILATLLRPTSGDVRYGGVPFGEAGDEVRARMGLVGHRSYLSPDLSARENLVFHARLHALDRVPERVEAVLAACGATAAADEMVRCVSRGTEQRMALARALLHDPTLLLLDEPFTGLDRASTARLVRLLGDLRRAGRTLLLSTHVPGVMAGVADRFALLAGGRLLRAGECPADPAAIEALTEVGI